MKKCDFKKSLTFMIMIAMIIGMFVGHIPLAFANDTKSNDQPEVVSKESIIEGKYIQESDTSKPTTNKQEQMAEEVDNGKIAYAEIPGDEAEIVVESIEQGDKADTIYNKETIPIGTLEEEMGSVDDKKTIPEDVYNNKIKTTSTISGQHYKAEPPYNKGEYIHSTLTIGGLGIGKEIILSVKEIEELSETTDMGYEGYYSTLTRGDIWDCKKMSGVDLYKLLVRMGMDEDLPDDTPITIRSKDGHSPGTLTLGDIKDTVRYSSYEYKGAEEALETELPVLVAYASENYPLVGPTGDESYSKKFKKEEGYVEEANNSGGPLRLIFGQENSNDYNAPKSSKFLDSVMVGEDRPYTQHTDDLKDELLTVKVFMDQPGNEPKTVNFSVAEIEEMAYKSKVNRVRNYYPAEGDFYEGLDLWYLLSEKVGLTSTEGIVYFYKDNSEIAEINMDYIRNPGSDYSNYYTSKDGVALHWVKPAIAYAKYGTPMSEEDGGPLAIVLPQNDHYLPGGLTSGCDEIHIYITDASYGHHVEPYDQWKDNTITITGDGVREKAVFTVEELEQQLNSIRKGRYYIKEDEDKGEIAEFIGLDLYALLSNRVGLHVSADKVIVKSADGAHIEFSLDEVKKTDYLNSEDNINDLRMLLAYGKNGIPLVPDSMDDGYDSDAKNSGGPFYLIVGQKDAADINAIRCVKKVVEIEVTVSDESWKHDTPTYDRYLDTTPLLIKGSEVKEPRVFTLRQLEAMTDGIVRDSFASSSANSGNYEGVILRHILEQVGLKEGIDKPSKITIYAGPDFSSEVSVYDVYNGIDSNYQPGEKRDVILAYAKDGYPLVPKKEDIGFVENAGNDCGPIRLVVENTINQWVKYVDEIIVGEGDYEEPKLDGKYIVKYLQLKVRDRDPDVELAETKTFFGNLGDTITVRALDIPGWVPDAKTKEITLKDGANEVEFRYALNVGLLLSGKEVNKDVYYTRSELQEIADNPQNKIRNYSVMKRGGIPAIIMGKGLDLTTFIENADIVREGNLDILCRAVDGWSGAPLSYDPITKSFGMKRYYYPNVFTGSGDGAEPVLPMLAFYNVEGQEKVPEIPTDKEGWREVIHFPNPSLMFGQSDPGEFNNQSFAKMLFAIEIGNTSGKEVLTISGEKVEKPVKYRLDQILGKGLENKKIGSNELEGISLSRILSDARVAEEAQIRLKAGKEEQSIVINAAEAGKYLISLNVKDNVVDKEAPLYIYYEKDGKEEVIKNITEIVCGKESNKPGDKENGDNGDSPAPRPIPGPKENGSSEEENNSTAGSQDTKNKEDILSADNLEVFDLDKYFEHEELGEKDGQKIEKIKINPEGVKLLADAPQGVAIPVKASKDVNDIELILTGDFVNAAREKGIVMQLKTSIGNYVLPLTEFDLDGIAEKLNCKKDEINMHMAIAQASTEKQKEIRSILPGEYSVLTKIVDFNVKFSFSDEEIPYNSFKNYIYHEIPLTEAVEPATTVGIYWDESGKRVMPMPTVIVQKDGKTFARVYRRGNSLYTVVSVKKTFEDMEEHWAQEDVELLGSKIILKGQTETDFKPDNKVNRAEFTVMLTRALGLTDQKMSDGFSDIKGNEWFAGSVGVAVAENIISGFPDGTFKPEKEINRQEMAVMIANALAVAGVQEKLDEEKIEPILSKFEDNQQMDNWAKESIALVTDLNIISGMPDGNFEPCSNATRAQAAIMIKGLLRTAGFIDERAEIISSEIDEEVEENTLDEKQKKEAEQIYDSKKGSSGSSRKSRKSSPDSSRDSEEDSKKPDNDGLPKDTKNMLVIEGSAVKTPKAFSLSDLKNMSGGRVTGNYFSRGRDTSENPREHIKCTGVSVYYLIAEAIELKSTPSKITVISEDGYRRSFPIEEVAGYYMDETDPENNALEMIIAWEENGSEYGTSEGAPFRLIVGQKFPEEYNRLKWVKWISKIQVE